MNIYISDILLLLLLLPVCLPLLPSFLPCHTDCVCTSSYLLLLCISNPSATYVSLLQLPSLPIYITGNSFSLSLFVLCFCFGIYLSIYLSIDSVLFYTSLFLSTFFKNISFFYTPENEMKKNDAQVNFLYYHITASHLRSAAAMHIIHITIYI